MGESRYIGIPTVVDPEKGKLVVELASSAYEVLDIKK